MRDVDRPVQVVIVSGKIIETSFVAGYPVEMGAVGDAVELIAIHYNVLALTHSSNLNLLMGLSSNPEHLLAPPADRVMFTVDPALYGTIINGWMRELVGESYGVGREYNPVIIPLHGLVRPRRQIFVVSYYALVFSVFYRAEIYYRPKSVGKDELDSINRKYGLYRRT